MNHRELTNLLNDRNAIAATLTQSPEDQAVLASKDAELAAGVSAYLNSTLSLEIRFKQEETTSDYVRKITAALPGGLSALSLTERAEAEAEFKAIGSKPEMQTLAATSAAADPDGSAAYESAVAWAEAQLAAGTTVENLTVEL